jgi:hypothetical protein
MLVARALPAGLGASAKCNLYLLKGPKGGNLVAGRRLQFKADDRLCGLTILAAGRFLDLDKSLPYGKVIWS